MKSASTKNSFITYLTLFSSAGTLVCCALPALFVSLGLGAVLAGVATKVPGLIWISEHKTEVFIFAALMLAANGLLMWFNRNAPCPIDPVLRDACITGRKFSSRVYAISVIIFLIGAFFAFIAPLL
ncbi:hypothetical protein ACLSU7_03225 [Bdellovibrio sp. HCB185ZH]|uniref:hypothetical protein n=1 Tax=Bdellovibrio sp. HCB185ZH TaxID=3394235 RepID=UPI0039A6657C